MITQGSFEEKEGNGAVALLFSYLVRPPAMIPLREKPSIPTIIGFRHAKIKTAFPQGKAVTNAALSRITDIY